MVPPTAPLAQILKLPTPVGEVSVNVAHIVRYQANHNEGMTDVYLSNAIDAMHVNVGMPQFEKALRDVLNVPIEQV
ncbi:hypothetical protein [Parvularcula sp. LCG005]|uniref:hypothetical protein n=1 Tax=Parvularcula sp. LCG005 TaxID=3078805 RepID=UPI002943DD96|nr:hypothetical protein [Parvularcula sp. LCG005]WOI52449.1 hypothetical protein RUI03_09845 [Parvularcula sp. LCG005]